MGHMSMESWSVLFLAIATSVRMVFSWLADKEAAVKLDHIKKVGDETHTLSNSAMGAQLKAYVLALKMYYLAMKRLAEITHDAGDMAAENSALNAWVAAERIAGRHDAQEDQAYKRAPEVIQYSDKANEAAAAAAAAGPSA